VEVPRRCGFRNGCVYRVPASDPRSRGAGGPSGHRDPSLSLPLICYSSIDAYTADPAILSECAIGTYPLLDTSVLADGGLAYEYNVDGAATQILVPPVGFNALTADPTTLATYGIPASPDPSDAIALADWRDMVDNLKFVGGPAALHTSPFKHDSTSLNWSGYEATGQTFTEAGNEYVEPTRHSGCSSDTATTWAGLGGGTVNDFLAQNGTDLKWPGTNPHQAWYEFVPGVNVSLNFYATAGYKFEANTSRQTGHYFFFFWNSYNDQTTAVNVANSNINGPTAEAIIERATGGGLANFGVASLQGWANLDYMVNFPHQKITMVNGLSLSLASPGAMGSDGSFTDTWVRCS